MSLHSSNVRPSLFALLVALCALSAGTSHAADPAACHIFVRDFALDGLSERESYLAPMVLDAVATQLSRRTQCRVTTRTDVRTLLDAEAERQLCGDDSESCLGEIGHALGADQLVAGSVRAIDDTHVSLSVRLLDVKNSAVLRRSETECTRDADALRALAPKIASELTVDAMQIREDGRAGLLSAGVVVAGSGAVAGALGGGLALWMNQSLTDPRTSSSTKEGQQMAGIVGLSVVAVATAATLVGGGLMVGGALP